VKSVELHPAVTPLPGHGIQEADRTSRSRRIANVRVVKQSVSLITLGVADYERAKSFYEALGWSSALEVEETAFFQANAVVLVLWAREKLAADTGIADDGSRWSGVTLAHNVPSRQEVDGVIEQARRNGARVTREPSETFYGGYAGVFRDLDGHAWEIAHNPGFGLRSDGSIIIGNDE
jgi:predicted lactoylglutathione lyase